MPKGGYWKLSDLRFLWDHPDWTSAEIGEAIGRSAQSVRLQRHRSGRYRSDHVPMCSMCEERPIWTESAKAMRYGLCKGCFLDEMEMRHEDDRRYAAYRQRAKARRDKHGRDEDC